MNAIESGVRLERMHIGSEQCLAFFTDDQPWRRLGYLRTTFSGPKLGKTWSDVVRNKDFTRTRFFHNQTENFFRNQRNLLIIKRNHHGILENVCHSPLQKKNEFQREQQPARVQTLAQLSPSRLPQLPMQLEVRFQRTADVSCTRSRINGDSAQAGEGNCTYLVVCTVFTAYFHRQIVHLARLLFQVVHFERLEYASYEDSKIQAVLTRTHSHDRQCIG